MLGCVAIPAPVVPATTTDDTAHSSTFAVPRYNTLTVEVWGPGRGGGSYPDAHTPNLLQVGIATAPSASSVSTLGMTANGGGNGNSNTATGGLLGGTASGGNTTNTTGTDTTASDHLSNVPITSGVGGGSPNGGATTGAVSSPSPSTGTAQFVAGITGNAPGGGGGGAAASKTNFSGSNSYSSRSGGPGGGYCKSVYTFGVTSGFPSVGDSLSYTVAAGTLSPGDNAPGFAASFGGNGRNGRVKFTVA